MPTETTYRVYADIVVQAAFDVVAGSAEDAADMLGCLDALPVHTEDRPEQIVRIHGAIASKDVFGATFDENMREIARRTALAARLAQENEDEAESRARGDDCWAE